MIFMNFVFYLQFSKNSDIILGDFNVVILRRIRGKFETYREADAFQFVLDIVIVGFLPSISKNSDIILGDFNVIILRRIRGKFELYREADAFQFVLNIVIVGYKLIFIKL